MTTTSAIVSVFQKYMDPNRKVGSQSERPNVSTEGDVVSVSGYQTFRIAQGRVQRAPLGRKYNSLYRYLLSNLHQFGPTPSLLDIGCSAGLLCFLAKELGFHSVAGLDHDPEYVETLKSISQRSGLVVTAHSGDWKDAPGTYDVVSALALVHWIYSLTGKEGAFSSIFEYLYTKANRYLMIEWVDPKDPAIGALQHTSANPEHHREPYELAHFEAAGLQYFGSLDAKIDTTATRCIYVFCKEKRVFGHSAVVYFHRTAVVKHFRSEVMRFHPQIYERERKALGALDGLAGIPSLLAADGQRIHMTNAGLPLTRDNIPADAEQQAQALVAQMAKKGVLHNDIHYDNVLVLNGRLHLIDFAWASAAGEDRAFLPKDIAVNYGSRAANEPVDDMAMFHRTLELVRSGKVIGEHSR
jgi:SAM-dependent methyltransferase